MKQKTIELILRIIIAVASAILGAIGGSALSSCTVSYNVSKYNRETIQQTEQTNTVDSVSTNFDLLNKK